MNMSREEYVALRNNNLSRRDYLNKLNTGLITFTTAVFTIAVSLFIFVANVCNTSLTLSEKKAVYQEKIIEIKEGISTQETLDATVQDELKEPYEELIRYCDKQLPGVNVSLVTIQLFQALLLLTPVLYSKVSYNHALENNVRISMNSDYLEKLHGNDKSLYSIRHNKYENDTYEPENLPDDEDTYPYHFGTFGSLKKHYRIGDLGNLHRMVAIISMVIGMLFGILVYSNLILGTAIDPNTTSLYKGLAWAYGVTFLFSLVSHLCCVCYIHNKLNQVPKPEKLDTKKCKNWNYGIMIGTMIALIICVAINTIWFASINTEWIDRIAITIITLVFSLFVVLCIFSFPYYEGEQLMAEMKVKHNRKAIKQAFTQTQNNIAPQQKTEQFTMSIPDSWNCTINSQVIKK